VDAGRAAGRRSDSGATAPVDGVLAATPWVLFRSPAFTREGLPHGGPDWSFATPRLPALSPDGASLLVANAEIVLGGAPNLALSVLRVSDGAVLSSHLVLTAAEFTAAGQISTPGDSAAARARVFASLAQRVRTRLKLAEAELAAVAWTPMPRCRIEDQADSVHPPCSMNRQRLDCSSLAMRFARGVLTGTWRRRPFRLARRNLVPAPVTDPSSGTIPVRACFGGAWFDSARGVFAGLLRNECQRGGDWCIVQPKWYAVQLPGPTE
jgi:hypothetical protein